MVMPVTRQCLRCRRPYTAGDCIVGFPKCGPCKREEGIERGAPCRWCGKKFEEHDEAPSLVALHRAVTASKPCGGWKKYYKAGDV
jgi:hypothetical protein